MRSAKPDKKANLNILKYAVDPNTGEVFTDDEEKAKILLKDYEGTRVCDCVHYIYQAQAPPVNGVR